MIISLVYLYNSISSFNKYTSIQHY